MKLFANERIKQACFRSRNIDMYIANRVQRGVREPVTIALSLSPLKDIRDAATNMYRSFVGPFFMIRRRHEQVNNALKP